MSELDYLHESIIAQLKESSTDTFNKFSSAFELLNSDKNKAKLMFLEIVKDTDYLISSMEFYKDQFKGLDRNEDYLYIGQLLNLQIKACYDLAVIFNSEKNLVEANRYNSKKDNYKKILYSYYLLAKDNPKVGKILEIFLREADILDSKGIK